MKREHVTLPTLQLAAAAFFIATCQAAAQCVDKSKNVVAPSNCDGTHAEEFFLVHGPVVRRAPQDDGAAEEMPPAAAAGGMAAAGGAAAGGFGGPRSGGRPLGG
ncbi:hypothetical protein B0O99DRAFT_588210 [Bisporella sp. PMI_857]|nr:hypothetical protein B0O99DRAFT_588210 [Bisporella sp. PMI_857]